MITIEIDKLQTVVLLLLTKLKERNGPSVVLKNDYYWDIDSEELYNPNEEPRDLGLGQLSFDWEHIQKANPDELIPHDFEKIAGILKAFSHEYSISF